MPPLNPRLFHAGFLRLHVLILALLGTAIGCTSLPRTSVETGPEAYRTEHYHPAEQLGDLFEQVQMQRIFADGKTFVDATPRQPPAVVRTLFQSERRQKNFDLRSFIDQHFEVPAAGAAAPDEAAPVASRVTMESHIQSLWGHLSRDADSQEAWSTLLPLSHPYVVPGGRFREIYYWDSYFTMLGLRADGQTGLVRSMVENFADLIDRYGHIPNGNRSYYLSRSQPPFFAAMLTLLTQMDGPAAAVRFLPQLEAEYNFWMDGENRLEPGDRFRRVVKMPDGSLLNRYYDDLDTPRPESWREDVLTAAEVAPKHRPAVWRNLRAAAESGWDFSSRWFSGGSLASIETTDILPVDLNSLLYHAERLLGELHARNGNDARAATFTQRADRRRAAIHTWFWNPVQNTFNDFHLGEGKPTGKATMAMVYPLYFGIASPAQADNVARYLQKNLLLPGGFVTSREQTGEQWDYPNGWAPLQWLAISGLRQYGHEELAGEAAARWLALNRRVYERTGRMMEKYNVADMELPAGGGEYPLQDGFGWTNGVARALLLDWPDLTEQRKSGQLCCE